MKKVLVNYASPGRENYLKAQERLIDSFKNLGWKGDYFFRSSVPRKHNGVNILLGDVRKHLLVPYGFKVDLLQQAEKKGYRKLMWADSTIKVLQHLDFVFDHAAKEGVAAFHNLGHDLHKYITDEAAAKLGILNHPEFENIQQIMACCFVFDLDNEKGKKIFDEFVDASYVEGMFQKGSSERKSFKGNNTGDQPVLSTLLFQHQVPLLAYGDLVYNPHDITKEYGEPYLVNAAI